MKVADCRFSWKKSVSTDVSKVTILLNTNGVEQETELPGADLESFDMTFNANASGTFAVKTFDGEGNVTVSQSISWSVGNLEAPAPATDLAFQILAVRDVPDAPTDPTEPPAAGKRR